MKQASPIVKLALWLGIVILFAAAMISYSGALAKTRPGGAGLFHLNFGRINFGSNCEPAFTLPKGERIARDTTVTYAVNEGGDFQLASCFGDVEIRTWERNEVEIRWSGKNGSSLSGVEVRAERTEKGVRVSGGYTEGWRRWWNGADVKYTVTLPASFHPNISVSGGDVRAANVRNSIEIETSGGDIVLDSVSGKARLETSGGDISINKAAGEIHAETSGGSIRLETLSGKVYAETSGGDITARVMSDTVAVQCETSGGDITLYLPETARTSISASTSGGSVGMELKNFRGKIEDGEIRGTINDGGGKTHLETSGGDIRVRAL